MKRGVVLAVPLLVSLLHLLPLFPHVALGDDRSAILLKSLERDEGFIPPDHPYIIISKKDHRLYLFKGRTLIKSYQIALGKRPRGDKHHKGDKRTPVGKFFICTKNPKSRFHLSLGLSYPSIKDARRGLAEGLISRKEYEKIVSAIRSGKKPPWDTALGGAICIHGGGGWSDWTEGCIAMYTKDIRDLYDRVSLGTPVFIVE